MKLGDLGEFTFIRRIEPGCIVAAERVVQGIGDDCSVIPGEGGSLRLLTTDLLVERVHFVLGEISGYQLGLKALAVSLSDIAAMGGTPLDAYISIAIPEQISLVFLDEFYGGLKSSAAQFDVNLLGGDTSSSKQDLVINVAVTGSVSGDRILYRRGARPGDALFVTGDVGDAGAGLHATRHGHRGRYECATILARRLNEPTPHLTQGKAIAATGRAHAMIDISDGVNADLAHICDQSEVGCVIESDLLPLSTALTDYCRRFELDPVYFALRGGEDYVLLCTGEEKLLSILSENNVDIYRVGHITADRSRILRKRDGSKIPLGSTGWNHFQGQR
jgi:thiamine-monophosphate kinase